MSYQDSGIPTKGVPVEVKIHLNKFKPRDYQLPIFKAFFIDHYRRMVIVLPRRCISKDTYISMANGSVKEIKDIKVGDKILSFNGKDIVKDVVKNVWNTGVKDAIEIVSKKYHNIIVSKDHKFFSDNAWVSSQQLKEKTGRKYPLLQLGDNSIDKSKDRDVLLSEFIGYLTHDGYVVGYQQPKFTNVNKEILDRVSFLSKELYGYEPIWRKKGNAYDIGLSNGTNGGGTFKNEVKELFRSVGLDIQKSKMWIHPLIWNMSKDAIMAYLRAVISCDGSIDIKRERTTVFKDGKTRHFLPCCQIKISCGSSKQLAIDTYWLMRKIGIIPQKIALDKTSNWYIRVSRYEAIVELLSENIYGKNEKRLKALNTIIKPSRSTKKYKDSNLKILSNYKIKDSDPCEMYDLETENNHNFFANGYLVHNSGKDLCAWNIVIREAINTTGVYYLVYPTYSQGKKILWSSITIQGDKFLDYIPRQLIESTNSQEMKVVLTNGSIIQIIGSDNPDRIVGTNPRGVVFSEYALQNPRIYALMAPILAANKGWAIFISTPRGKNSFWELYQIASNSPSWFVYKLGLNETKHIDPVEIEREISEGLMSPDLVEQEYHCSFLAGVEGSYYCKYLDRMRLNSQIGTVPWEAGFKVHTAWDIGVRDSTTIIFFQTIGQTVRIIDYYEKNKEGLEHYVNYVLSKEYVYGRHIAPHDIAVKEFGSGMTRIEKAKQLGINFTVASNISIMDGIESVRSALSKIWIDEVKCAKLIKAIENYRQEYDEKRQVYRDQPLHDIFSHACDALRYLCVSLPKTRDGISPDDLDRLRNEALYGDDSKMPAFFRSNKY
jgi:hypothetical protein